MLTLPDLEEGQTVDDLNVCEEAKRLIGFWINKAASRPVKSPSKWFREGVYRDQMWGLSIRRRIARQLRYIRHWRVHNSSYEAAEREGSATWFIDPPYQIKGSHYKFGSKGLDYSRLADWCRSRRGQVIVCENEGAKWLDFKFVGAIKAGRTQENRFSREVVWINDPGED